MAGKPIFKRGGKPQKEGKTSDKTGPKPLVEPLTDFPTFPIAPRVNSSIVNICQS